MPREHHRDRRRRLLAAGRCPGHAGEFVLHGLKHCERCRAFNRRSYLKHRALAKAEGRCVRHTRQPARPGRYTCQRCTDQQRLREAARGRTGRQRAYRASRYHSRVRQGGCPKHPGHERAGCRECLDAKRKADRARDRLRRGGRSGHAPVNCRDYKATTVRMPRREPDEFNPGRLDRLADAVSELLRLMLAEGRDLSDVTPDEVVSLYEGKHRLFASEAGALTTMFATQWGKKT